MVLLPTPPAVCQELGGRGGAPHDFCLVSYIHTQITVRKPSFPSPEFLFQIVDTPARVASSRFAWLQSAALADPLCLGSHASFSLFNSFGACLDSRTGWRVLVRINHTIWQASVSLTHLGAGIQPCKTAQPIYYSLIIRPN